MTETLTEFELIIKQKAAKRLGLQLPPNLPKEPPRLPPVECVAIALYEPCVTFITAAMNGRK